MFRKIILIFSLLIMSCKSGGNFDQPPEIRYGEDPCDECFMLINESRFAATYITFDDQVKRFDDIGCLLLYQKEHDEDVAHFWVKDFNTQKWLKADNALFISSDSIQTPMGFGIIAFENEKTVRDIFPSQNQDQILKFPQLLEITKELYY
jgi:copper chaperone NosL